MQENVIVVTFNYRLSALGFLYLPEAGIYGNAALKDQVSPVNSLQTIIIFFCYNFQSLASGIQMGPR